MILDGARAQSIEQAVHALREGALVGLPTETVYGLAADADNPAAVAAVFATKGRPSDHPLIVHVPDAAAATHFAAEVPAFARALMDAFWPGPLTLILPRRAGVAEASPAASPPSGCAAPRTRWPRRCCAPARPPACTGWPRRAPTASAA